MTFLLFVGTCGYPFYQQERLWHDPRFDLAKLRAFTPEQVVERLGPPTYDGRNRFRGATIPNWRDDDPSDPLILAYDRGYGTVAIDFLQNRAFNVRKFAR